MATKMTDQTKGKKPKFQPLRHAYERGKDVVQEIMTDRQKSIDELLMFRQGVIDQVSLIQMEEKKHGGMSKMRRLRGDRDCD